MFFEKIENVSGLKTPIKKLITLSTDYQVVGVRDKPTSSSVAYLIIPSTEIGYVDKLLSICCCESLIFPLG